MWSIQSNLSTFDFTVDRHQRWPRGISFFFCWDFAVFFLGSTLLSFHIVVSDCLARIPLPPFFSCSDRLTVCDCFTSGVGHYHHSIVMWDKCLQLLSLGIFFFLKVWRELVVQSSRVCHPRILSFSPSVLMDRLFLVKGWSSINRERFYWWVSQL